LHLTNKIKESQNRGETHIKLQLKPILIVFCFSHINVTWGNFDEMMSETIPLMLLSSAGTIL